MVRVLLLAVLLASLAGCAPQAAVDFCTAAKNPAAYAGRVVQGRVAIISARPHGSFFHVADCKGAFGVMLIHFREEAGEDRLSDLWNEADRDFHDPKVVEGAVTGTLQRLDQGGWGLDDIQLEALRVVRVKGGPYAEIEWMW